MEMRCGAARLWMTARDDGGGSLVGVTAWLEITREFWLEWVSSLSRAAPDARW